MKDELKSKKRLSHFLLFNSSFILYKKEAQEAMRDSTQALVLVGSYAEADKPGLYGFIFDSAAGTLTPQGSFAGIASPAFLVVHPNGRWVYTVSETSQAQEGVSGAVWALNLAREPWAITPINHQPSDGEAPCHLRIDATGRWLFVSNYLSGNVIVLPIGADGALGERTTFVQHHGSGPNLARQAEAHAHSTTLTPDNRFAIVADLGIDQLVTYAFDAEAGTLTPHAQTAAHPGAGPRHLAFHPSGRVLYAANELGNTVTVYAYDPAGGLLHELQTLPTVPPCAPEDYVSDIHITAAGERVYISNRGHDSIAVFDAAADGHLTPVAVLPCGGAWPRNFAVAPGEQFLVVGNQYSDEVVVLPLRPGAEAVGAPVARVALAQPACVLFVDAQP